MLWAHSSSLRVRSYRPADPMQTEIQVDSTWVKTMEHLIWNMEKCIGGTSELVNCDGKQYRIKRAIYNGSKLFVVNVRMYICSCCLTVPTTMRHRPIQT